MPGLTLIDVVIDIDIASRHFRWQLWLMEMEMEVLVVR
jgi:hypothetical protein